MRLSVLTPTYNSARTIQATLDSALNQTRAADEIIVVDDGSTDETVSLVRRYEPRVRLFQEPHRGLAGTRNTLVDRAQGEILAFLDSDDLWHPQYLEMQLGAIDKKSDACAVFAGHVNLFGFGMYTWDRHYSGRYDRVEFMGPVQFLKRYHHATGPFASPSFCCIPRQALLDIGPRPFGAELEDMYIFNMLCLSGRPIVYNPVPLAAYRITDRALSADQLKMLRLGVDAFGLLEPHFRGCANRALYLTFREAFASKTRAYAQVLMGTAETLEARRQLRASIKKDISAVSAAKSIALLLLSYMPSAFHPRWPARFRKVAPVEACDDDK